MLIPLYGFLQGDTIGLLVLVHDHQTIADVAANLQRAAEMRVKPSARARVYRDGKLLDPTITVAAAGLSALERVDVIPEGG